MIRVTYDVYGEEQYDRMFHMLDAASDDLTVPFTRVVEDLKHQVEEQFVTEGGRSGIPWARLSEPYGAWKEEHFPGAPLLVRSGALKDAFGTIEMSPKRLAWGVSPEAINDDGTRVEVYARAHQTGYTGIVELDGGTLEERHLPARPMIALTGLDRRGFDRHFVEWMNEAKKL